MDEQLKTLALRVHEFIVAQNRQYKLFEWSLTAPLDQRVDALLASSPELAEYVRSVGTSLRSVLDCGSGLSMVWPFFREWGFSEFVGVDLFGLRGRLPRDRLTIEGNAIERTANELCKTFCADCDWSIVRADVRDLAQHITDGRKFDVVMAQYTNYKKLGSTGIPRDVFQRAVDAYLAEGGIAIYVD